MRLGNVISSLVEQGKRVVKATTLGSNRETPKTITPGCIDFHPEKNMKPIIADTSNSSTPIVVGYLNKSVVENLNSGEAAFYSLDNKNISAVIIAKNNGVLELNGNNDFAVRFTKLEEAYNELKGSYNNLVTIFNAHIHIGVVSGPAVSGTTSTPGTPSQGDISQAKIYTIRVP